MTGARISVVLALSLALAGCAGDNDESRYSVNTTTEYVGKTMQTPPKGYYEWFFIRIEEGQEDGRARLVLLLTADPEGDRVRTVPRVDLVVVGRHPAGIRLPLDVTDAITLATEDPDVWLAAQCPSSVAGAGVGVVAVMSRASDGTEQVLRLWDYDARAGLLVEIDSGRFEKSPSCHEP